MTTSHKKDTTMSTVTIIAKVKAKPQSIEYVQHELLKLVAPTRLEAGCIDYHLHQDQSEPTQFLFYERWESAGHLDQHMQSDHFNNLHIALTDRIEGITIQELNILD